MEGHRCHARVTGDLWYVIYHICYIVYNISYIMYQISYIIYRIPNMTVQIKSVLPGSKLRPLFPEQLEIYERSPVSRACHRWPFICHISYIIYDIPYIIYYISYIISHTSCITLLSSRAWFCWAPFQQWRLKKLKSCGDWYLVVPISGLSATLVVVEWFICKLTVFQHRRYCPMVAVWV